MLFYGAAAGLASPKLAFSICVSSPPSSFELRKCRGVCGWGRAEAGRREAWAGGKSTAARRASACEVGNVQAGGAAERGGWTIPCFAGAPSFGPAKSGT